MRQFSEHVRYLGESAKGVAAIEFAFIAPALVALLLGITEYGLLIFERSKMTSAVGTGSHYFMAGGEDPDEAVGIIKGGWSQMPDNTTVTIREYCLCSEQEHICTANCDDGSLPLSYKQIVARTVYEGIFYDTVYEVSDNVRVR